MSQDKDRSQKRKAKLEARRKRASAKAGKALAKQGISPQTASLGGGLRDAYLVRPRGDLILPGSECWPVVRAYAPVPDIWAATGYGTAAIARQSPKGQIIEADFRFTAREGLDAIFGKPDVASLEKLTLKLPAARDLLPPYEQSTPERAAEFIWGAFALARQQGAMFPGMERYLYIVPRVAGNERAWRERFVGPGGMTPGELVELVMSLPEDAFSDTMEPAVFTTVSFRVDDPAAAIEALAGKEPELSLASRKRSDVVFNWTRAYPKGHWSPLAKFGGRQSLGSVTVGHGKLVAEAKTLSMTARLMGVLKQLLGSSLGIETARWESPHDEKIREVRFG